jgi:hypothetical protein
MRVATVVTPPAAEGAAAGIPEAPEVGPDDTQLLKTGDAADATSVIPPEELDKLRGEPPGNGDEGGSWYQVLEPSPPAEQSDAVTDLVGEEDEPPAEPERPDEAAEGGGPEHPERSRRDEEDAEDGEPRTTRIRKRTTGRPD